MGEPNETSLEELEQEAVRLEELLESGTLAEDEWQRLASEMIAIVARVRRLRGEE